MKKKYFFNLLFIFITYYSFGQSCPPAGNLLLDGTRLVFNYDPGTSDCVDRPTVINVDTSVFELDGASCSDIVSIYNLTSGPAIPDSNFVITSGFATTCSYSNGTLPTEDFNWLDQAVSIYPNPVNNNKLNIKIASYITASVSLYSVTGKRVVTELISNNDFKSIDVSGINNGIYMLKIETDEVSVTHKVVIMQ